MRVLLDSNIILDFLLDRLPFADAATAVWQANEQGRFDLLVLQSALAFPLRDYEDAVQLTSATASQMDAIVTRDTRDHAGATLPVLTPQDLLDQLNRQLR